MASCVPYDLSKMKSYRFQIKLIVISIIIMLKHLNENGFIIVNLTYKNLYPIYNLIYILQAAFNSFALWKSTTIWKFTKSFYFFGYGFKKNKDIINILENFLLLTKDKTSSVYSQFYGSENDYNNITDKFEIIYKNLIKNYNLLEKNK